MKIIIAISTLLATAACSSDGFITPLAAISSPISSQYHAQDDFGQYTYGYANHLSAKSEARSIDGSVLGSYSYVDANGKIQTVEYTADDQGFRVAASNIPIAPLAPEVQNIAAPEPVQDTPEVIEARAKHFAAIEEVKKRSGQEEGSSEVNNSVEIPAARSAVAVKTGNTPVAITSSVPVGSLLPVYRPALFPTPAVAIKSFASPAIAVKTTPLSTSFAYSYGLNNLYQYTPTLYQYPAYYSYATHVATPQAFPSNVADTTVIENAELAKEEGKEENRTQ